MKNKIKRHNPERYGETYDLNWINSQIEILEKIKDSITLSGGWAWHFISPEHKEYKHLHDHKDIDIFVLPEKFLDVQLSLEKLDFHRMKTKYDNNEFIRYEKTEDNNKKIVIDMFKGSVPNIEVKGWKIVDPAHLLSLYYKSHQSDHCIAVKASRSLMKHGINIVDNEKLIELPSYNWEDDWRNLND